MKQKRLIVQVVGIGLHFGSRVKEEEK